MESRPNSSHVAIHANGGTKRRNNHTEKRFPNRGGRRKDNTQLKETKIIGGSGGKVSVQQNRRKENGGAGGGGKGNFSVRGLNHKSESQYDKGAEKKINEEATGQLVPVEGLVEEAEINGGQGPYESKKGVQKMASRQGGVGNAVSVRANQRTGGKVPKCKTNETQSPVKKRRRG